MLKCGIVKRFSCYFALSFFTPASPFLFHRYFSVTGAWMTVCGGSCLGGGDWQPWECLFIYLFIYLFLINLQTQYT